MGTSLRNGFIAGLLLALIIGIYLFRLWQPERQVELHSLHLLQALERKGWSDVAAFVDPTYKDRWGHDHDLLLARLRFVLPYAQNLHLDLIGARARVADGKAEWSARITVQADPNDIADMIKARVNTLDEPFLLQWQRVGKPWEWRLVRIDNSALEVPEGVY
jgi:hypothetical protein